MASSIYYEKGKECYDEGNFIDAVEWYRKGARQEHPDAQNGLGFLYTEGHGVPQDYEEAVKWYRLAAEQEFAEAQFNLGHLFADVGFCTALVLGSGVIKNLYPFEVSA